MISYILPTRNRPQRLQRTLEALTHLPMDEHAPVGGAEVVVVDDAGDDPINAPNQLDNGMAVTLVRTDQQLGAAARNLAAHAASGEWIIMLDDDSAPVHCGHVHVIAEAAVDVSAIGAEILLKGDRHEDGGLPEVIIGCGAALRREVFLDLGGYDERFHFYVEEYDLCAKMIAAGWRIEHDRRFLVRHEKTQAGRDMNLILQRLVRNNGWIMQRYAPAGTLEESLAEVRARYGRIAEKENAVHGYEQGRVELEATLDEQPRAPLSAEQWDRFTGLAHVRRGIDQQACEGASIAMVEEGKNHWAVRTAIGDRADLAVVPPNQADVIVMGSLSPGPALDAYARQSVTHPRAILPWTMPHWTADDEA